MDCSDYESTEEPLCVVVPSAWHQNLLLSVVIDDEIRPGLFLIFTLGGDGQGPGADLLFRDGRPGFCMDVARFKQVFRFVLVGTVVRCGRTQAAVGW